MNKFSAVLLSLAFASSPLMANDLKPVIVGSSPTKVFTPSGFDSNDNSQVVIDGYLSDTCHKVGPTKIKVDKENKVIKIRHTAYHYQGSWCAQVAIPYFKALDLGVLDTGNYKVMVEKSEGKFVNSGALGIHESNTIGPDDYTYAPVSEVSLEKLENGKTNLVLRGNYTSTCMRLKEVRPIYSPGNVIEVLPIVDLSQGPTCKDAGIPFTAKVELRDTLEGRTLIHVRSLSGQAINQVFNF